MAGGSDDRKHDDRLGATAKALRQAQPYIDASWQLIGAVALGTLGGYYLDRWLGTTPWLLVAGAALGVTAGLISFFRVILRLEAQRPHTKFEVRSFEERRQEDRPRGKDGEDGPEKQ